MSPKQSRIDVAVLFFGLVAILLSLAAGAMLGNGWFGVCLAAIVTDLVLMIFMVGVGSS